MQCKIRRRRRIFGIVSVHAYHSIAGAWTPMLRLVQAQTPELAESVKTFSNIFG